MSEVKFYGTMPAVLPKTLPDGTLCKAGWRHYGVRLVEGGRYEETPAAPAPRPGPEVTAAALEALIKLRALAKGT